MKPHHCSYVALLNLNLDVQSGTYGIITEDIKIFFFTKNVSGCDIKNFIIMPDFTN